jgi:hypothetical protein
MIYGGMYTIVFGQSSLHLCIRCTGSLTLCFAGRWSAGCLKNTMKLFHHLMPKYKDVKLKRKHFIRPLRSDFDGENPSWLGLGFPRFQKMGLGHVMDTTYMVKDIVETFWHEPQISCLPPYEQVTDVFLYCCASCFTKGKLQHEYHTQYCWT